MQRASLRQRGRPVPRPWPRRAGALVAAVVLAVAAAGTAGCQTIQDAPKTTIGGLGGAVAGGILGERLGGHTGGIIAGSLIGGLLGGAIGNILDQRDRELALKTAHETLETAPTGNTSTWVNPDTGHQGSFTPTRTWQEPSGRYCREYQQTIVVGGETQQSYGTACRQPDGSWQVVS